MLTPTPETWQPYHERPDEAMFLDIETTGLSPEENDVTVIGAITGGQSAVFVKGINLEDFPAYVEKRPLLVSFNGIQFDVPFLRMRLPEARLDQPHIDLRFVLRSLGYRACSVVPLLHLLRRKWSTYSRRKRQCGTNSRQAARLPFALCGYPRRRRGSYGAWGGICLTGGVMSGKIWAMEDRRLVWRSGGDVRGVQRQH